MNPNKLAEEIFQANKEKGFWDEKRNIGEMLMLITSELGEAMEAHRKNRMCTASNRMRFEEGKGLFNVTIKDTFEDELADAMIRIFDMAGGLNIDLDFHVREKLKYNTTRARLHGKNY